MAEGRRVGGSSLSGAGGSGWTCSGIRRREEALELFVKRWRFVALSVSADLAAWRLGWLVAVLLSVEMTGFDFCLFEFCEAIDSLRLGVLGVVGRSVEPLL